MTCATRHYLSSPTPFYHVEVQQGDDRPIRLPVAIMVNGALADLTGWPVRAQLRATARNDDPVHTWSSITGSAATEAHAVLLLVDDSRFWSFTGGVFDVELTHPGGEKTIEATGSLHVKKAVTR